MSQVVPVVPVLPPIPSAVLSPSVVPEDGCLPDSSRTGGGLRPPTPHPELFVSGWQASTVRVVPGTIPELSGTIRVPSSRDEILYPKMNDLDYRRFVDKIKVVRRGRWVCWEFQTYPDRFGYRRFWLAGKKRSAHVVAYT